LDEDHYDLAKVKDRIVEYLAVRKLKGDAKGPILCFVGPPGVGKTSLGRSIARAMGRKFYRMSLGGVRDEAEIRGFRRTYIGSMPGRIIQGIKHCGTNNPVFMLDEVDKLGMDFRGDPAAALLEVLDPEQNFSFSDHYLDVPFDLSKVMFITTANVIDPIPSALKDRMEVLELPGYIEEEKVNIALSYLVPRQVKENGLTPALVEFQQSAIAGIINQYTRESGVRNLEREIGAICRKIAKDVASGNGRKRTVTAALLHQFLGPQKFFPELAERAGEVGVATGLAWTPVGGEILFIESSKMPGKKGLQLTGLLGDVMKESAQAALSHIRSKARQYRVDPKFFEKYDIHVHVPSGAIPKDGPSAGVTMVTSLVSLLSGRPVRPFLAMTGEVTLRGKVMPVGGIKEKVIAAHRAGIREVIMPTQNEKDLEEVPDHVKRKLRFHFADSVDQVVKLAFTAPRRGR
ncbi:MAG: endopeptidase La, partial [Candidatus Edwardsbacteria bacterium]|nr:endopeptidase La [Candidatus Edwardsbacteria bacterium]